MKKMLILFSIVFALVLNMFFIPVQVNADTVDENPIVEVENEEKEQDETDVKSGEGSENEEETLTEATTNDNGEAKNDDLVTEPVTNNDQSDEDDVHGGQIFDIQKAKVIITKVDEEGNPLSGAVLQILDSTGKVLDEWTSNGEEHVIELPDGNYTLHEKEAPEGYDLAEDKPINVKVEIAEINAGADFSQTPCSHYGGTPMYYVEIEGKKNEVYCINQNLETPDENSIYDGEILNATSIRDYTKQTIPVDIKSNDIRESIMSNGPVDVSDPTLTDQELYDKILDIIYHRHTAAAALAELGYEYSTEEIRYITEVALKNYTNPGLAELQYNTKATEELIKIFDENGVIYKRYKDNTSFEEAEDGAYVSYLKHNYRDYEYVKDAKDNESIVKLVYGTGNSFGQMVASHWSSKHNANTSGSAVALAARATVARYYVLFEYLIKNEDHHPSDMNLYIYSSNSKPDKISGNDNEPDGKYQNLLGVTGYFEEVKQQEIEVELEDKYSTEKVEVTVKKVWDDKDNQDGKRPENITVELSNGETVTLNEENNWTATIKDLPKYDKNELITYTWKEVELPEGYTLTSTKTEGYVTTITNSHAIEEVEVTIKKVWNDNNNENGKRPESITAKLSNGETVTLNEENNWTATIKNLPKYNNGKEIVYTWEESNIEGYKLSNTDKNGNITTLTNTEIRDIEVSKVWHDKDNQYKVRVKEVKVNIIANGEVIKTITLSEDNNWTETLKDLPVYENNKKIKYEVSEFKVEHYEVVIKENEKGFVIHNYYDKETPPDTVDNITTYITMSIVSSILLIGTIIVYRKKLINE